MWSKVIAKDLTNEDVLKKETLRAKWEANPITDEGQTNAFLKYVLSVLETEKQEGIQDITDLWWKMSAHFPRQHTCNSELKETRVREVATTKMNDNNADRQ